MSSAFERQVKPIYDAIDSGSPKSALVTCNKLLKKYPKNELLKALKSLALVRCQRVEEALIVCDEVLAAKPTHEAILSVMMHVLRGLGRLKDLVTMYEEAYRQQPGNEELANQTFFANVRTGHWKIAQQLATKMHKTFHEDRYLYWSVMSAVLQAHDHSTPPSMRKVLYGLAHRMITSSPTPSYRHADRFYLHLIILQELSLFDDAKKLLDSDIGRSICTNNLSCKELRREIFRQAGWLREDGKHSENLISEKHDRNWLEFISVLDGTVSDTEPLTADTVAHVRQLFEEVAQKDGLRDRTGRLALLELERRTRLHSQSKDYSRLLDLLQHYFQEFGDKACCFEDLKPFLSTPDLDLTTWTSFLQSQSVSFNTLQDLQRLINSHKLLRYTLSSSDLTVDSETSRADAYISHYLQGLALGTVLPSTELQPADDLAILAGHVFVNLWTLTNDEKHLYKAMALLEFALTKSPQAFQMRLMLVRIYRLLGVPSISLEHYRLVGVKNIQHDTLSHFVLSQSAMFSLAALGDLTFISECQETNQCYHNNTSETGEFIARAFQNEKYSQVPEFVLFEDRVENSLQRDIIRLEFLRMRLTHEVINTDLIDLELIELKFSFDRPTNHDNRDFDILPNYQPQSVPSFDEQTLLFGKKQDCGWASIFLKIYIRALQQASDLDDVVEEKLLIGDRPKQDDRPLLQTRLLERSDEELTELTSDEQSFLKFADALAGWLEPYHNYARPPPQQVLAEASKQTELRTGFPLKGVDTIVTQNGHSSNGKKDEEPPVFQEPPEYIFRFFDDLGDRYNACRTASSVCAALHVACLLQQALILSVVQTNRFKPASVVKVYKFGQLVASIKTLRGKALLTVKEVATDIEAFAVKVGSTESRDAIASSLASLKSSGITEDFLAGISKSATEARKKAINEPVCHPSVTWRTTTRDKTTTSGIKMSDYYSNINGGGGGFMQSSPYSQSPGGGGGAQRTDPAQSTRPVTIAQMHRITQAHSDAEFRLDGFELGHIRIVGQVISISRQTTNTVYAIDDGTGRFEARHWTDNSNPDANDKWAGTHEGNYVRVTGNLKAFSNKKYVNATQIQPIQDHHEPYFHFLECIAATMMVENGPGGTAGAHGNADYGHQGGGNQVEAHPGLNTISRAILQAIKEHGHSDGVHVASIARTVGGKPNDISEALEKLMDDGLVYTTIDDAHFAISE